MASPTCPSNAFLLNSTCICNPGYFLSSGACQLFLVKDSSGNNETDTSSYSFDPAFDPNTYLAKNSDTAQTVFLVIMLSVLGVWIGLTLYLRFLPMRGIFFTLRRFVSFVDYAFSKKHWIDEQKVQVKRKTELGGMLSICAFIFIIGLCLGIVYDFVFGSTSTVQNIVPTSGQDVSQFRNAFAFNFTFVSSMKCVQLRPFPYIITGDSLVTYRYVSVASLVNISCYDTDMGPMVSVTCPKCQIAFDNYYNRFSFVDLPAQGLYAAATGFIFSVSTTGTQGSKARSSFVNGRISVNGNSPDLVTMRGPPTATYANVINFRFVPRVFQQDGNLNLMQAAYHEFIPGPTVNSTADFTASLMNSSNGVELVVNTEVLSSYLVSTSVTARIGILTFLSRIGGIYQLGILLFFWTLNMSERYIPFLRYDDKLLKRLEKQRLSRYRWRKLRVAVKYGLLTRRIGEKHEGAAEALDSPATELQSNYVSASLPTHRGSLFGSSREGISLRKLESYGRNIRSFREADSGPQQERKGSNPLAALLPRLHASPRNDFLVSKSMERKAREEVQSEVPDLHLPPILPDLPPTLTHQASADPEAPPVVKPHIVERMGKAVVSGLRLTGELTHTLGMTQSSHSSRSAGDAVPSVIPAEEAAALGHSEKQQQKKRKKKGRDTRLGSTSEHTGSYVRKLRSPSWIPDYQQLPAVPDIAEELRKAKLKHGKKEAAHEEAVEKEQQEEEVEMEPLELYNYLIDLHDYQARLRQDFLAAQTMLENVVQRFRPHSDL